MAVTAATGPLSLAREDADRVRTAIADAGYTLERIVAVLGVKNVRALERVPAETIAQRLGSEPLDVFAKLFMLGGEVEREAAAAALGRLSPEEGERIGLLERRGGSVRAALRIVPDEELVLASDWPGSAGRPLVPDHVLGNNPTAQLLDNVTIRRPVGAVLDLGTGCGVQALTATRHAEEVVATDLNPRAVNLAAFNAVLNEMEVECLDGDLFEPVGERRFDLIVANPPFVISPESSFLFRDSELGGEGIARKIISEARGHLNDGGICQFLSNWAQLDGGDGRERIRAAFEGCGCDVWVIVLDDVDPAVYAGGWIRQDTAQPEQGREALAEWLSYYEREGITGVSWAVVTMRAADGDGWLDVSEMPEQIENRCGDHLLRCFEGRDLLARSDEEGLLALAAKVAPETRLEQSFTPEPEGWTPAQSRLASEDGLPTAGGVDAHVANFLIRCDGRTTVREALELAAADAEVSFEEMRPEGLKIVRLLFEGGYLVADP